MAGQYLSFVGLDDAAVNFSHVPRDRWWGRLLRAPLALLPDDWVVPVLQGPGQGLQWIIGSANHGCWLGSYEANQTRLVASELGAGDVVYDLGAHVGWYTLIASRIVGPEGRVVAFEPLPENLAYLDRHLGLNGGENVTVLPLALANRSGDLPFQRGKNRFQGRIAIDSDSDLIVDTATIDGLVKTGQIPPPDLMKIDVEGAEVSVLQGASSVLRVARPTVLVSTHGQKVKERTVALLREDGYEIEFVSASTLEKADAVIARPGG